MFKVNDSVVYETAGVCIIKDICTQSYIKNKEQKYYILDPVYKDARQVTIMIPIDTKKKLRRVISKDEIHVLIESMPQMETLWEENVSQRTEQIKQIMKDCDLSELTNLIKTFYQRKEDLTANGKKLPKADKDQFDVLEKRFTEELAFALGIEPEDVISYIDEQHKQLAASIV